VERFPVPRTAAEDVTPGVGLAGLFTDARAEPKSSLLPNVISSTLLANTGLCQWEIWFVL